MDPLSDVLALLKPRSYMFRGLDAGGRWSIHYPEGEGVKCYAVLSGECWLALDGSGDALRLAAGDCVLLPRGFGFRFASDRDRARPAAERAAPRVEQGLETLDAERFFSGEREGGVAVLGGGGACFGIGGYFDFDGDHAEILLSVLPPIVHIRNERDKATLRWCLERLMLELREPKPGGALIGEHLAHMLLVLALRLHTAEGSGAGVGWLFALADKALSAAISAIHEDPGRRWTVQALAARAGMSRTSFALMFKSRVGQSPMEYLTRWRMVLAGHRLANSREPISAIAPALGYESDSAFSTAFKRVMGCAPRVYARGRAPSAAARPQTDIADATWRS